jgi:50S ribosomal subunit-associated GTPase HflX
VHAALEDAGVTGERRVVVVLNKADRLSEDDRADRLARTQERGWEALLVSALTKDGVEALGRRIIER